MDVDVRNPSIRFISADDALPVHDPVVVSGDPDEVEWLHGRVQATRRADNSRVTVDDEIAALSTYKCNMLQTKRRTKYIQDSKHFRYMAHNTTYATISQCGYWFYY